MIDNKTLNCDEDVVGFTVEPNKFYSFYINDTENLNCSFQFYSDKENYLYSFDYDIEPLKNGYETLNGDETILTNIYFNDTENVAIIIKANKKEEEKEKEIEKEKEKEKEEKEKENKKEKEEEEEKGKEKEKEEEEKSQNKTNNFYRSRKTNRGLSKTGIVLVSVLVPLGLIGIVTAMIVLTRKVTPLNNTRENNNKIDSIMNLNFK